VQPKAATMLARRPRASHAETVYTTPVPGEATTTSVVTREATLIAQRYRPA
jgi:hypothetical protein